MALLPKPKLVQPFLPANGGGVSFDNIGQSNETLKLIWTYPLGVFGTKSFVVGNECFLESPNDIALVPDEHIIASLSMSAILAGEIMPGTAEWIAAILGQDTKNFQTIVGEAKLKVETASFNNPQIVYDTNYGPNGTVFDIVVSRSALLSATKTIRTDAWSVSQYGNRVDSVDHMVYCVPGAIFKEFPTLKKSNLGASGSTNRQNVIDWVQNQPFWV